MGITRSVKPDMMSLMRLFAILLSAAAMLSAQNSTVPIDNDRVRVTAIKQDPHINIPLHDHKLNRVMIYLDPGKQDLDYQGKKVHLVWKAGETKWSQASGMHTGEIISDNPVRVVEVELKKPGTSAKSTPVALDPLKILPKYYKLEYENDQVRVFRVKVGPHQALPLHEHARNRVTVFLTDHNFRVTPENGKVETQTHKVGDVTWGEPAKHKEENLSDKPFEVLVVELKS